jgi:hypothetical protein
MPELEKSFKKPISAPVNSKELGNGSEEIVLAEVVENE